MWWNFLTRTFLRVAGLRHNFWSVHWTVLTTILWRWVGAVSCSFHNSSSTGNTAGCPCSPLCVSTIYCNKIVIVTLVIKCLFSVPNLMSEWRKIIITIVFYEVFSHLATRKTRHRWTRIKVLSIKFTRALPLQLEYESCVTLAAVYHIILKYWTDSNREARSQSYKSKK